MRERKTTVPALLGAMAACLACSTGIAAEKSPETCDGRELRIATVAGSISETRNQQRRLAASRYTRDSACLPAGGVSQADVLIAAVTYLKENPQRQGLPPGVLLSNALRQTYPCSR